MGYIGFIHQLLY